MAFKISKDLSRRLFAAPLQTTGLSNVREAYVGPELPFFERQGLCLQLALARGG